MKKILIFKGGGYDGCFWEWNAVIFDNGEADFSFVTGQKGKELRRAIERDGAFRAIRDLKREDYQDIFIVRNEKDWEFACKEFNSGLIRAWGNAAGFQVRCDACGCFFSAEEIVHTGYEGNGGIGIQYTDNKCRECADEEHEEYIADEWKRYLRLKDKVAAIQKARRDGYEVSVFAARRDALPVPAQYVWEAEYY